MKDSERNLCQDLLAIENTNSDFKVHALHFANEQSGWDLVIFDWFVLIIRMQVILDCRDSLFPRPGPAPSGNKGEFRD